MPLFDFECTLCKAISEVLVITNTDEIICPVCKTGDAVKIFRGTRFIPFKPYVEYNLGDKPIEITSKKQLDTELKNRGLAMDNRPIGLKYGKRKREELKKKAVMARERINASG